MKKMTIERAMEILDPTHCEHYDSIETVNEACRMGMDALAFRKKKAPFINADGDLFCQTCGTKNYIYKKDGNRNWFCGYCGQAIDWMGE